MKPKQIENIKEIKKLYMVDADECRDRAFLSKEDAIKWYRGLLEAANKYSSEPLYTEDDLNLIELCLKRYGIFDDDYDEVKIIELPIVYDVDEDIKTL